MQLERFDYKPVLKCQVNLPPMTVSKPRLTEIEVNQLTPNKRKQYEILNIIKMYNLELLQLPTNNQRIMFIINKANDKSIKVSKSCVRNYVNENFN